MFPLFTLCIFINSTVGVLRYALICLASRSRAHILKGRCQPLAKGTALAWIFNCFLGHKKDPWKEVYGTETAQITLPRKI